MSIDEALAKVAPTPSEDELLHRVEELAPLIRAHVEWQESNRRMAPEVFDALSQSGMFALWKPRAVGGYETHPVTALKVFEALSRIDASVGWAVANQDGVDTMTGAVLDAPGALEMLADPKLPVSGASFPPGVARRVDGGYVVSGRWPFSSTCHYAQALMGLAILHDDDGPVIGPDGLARPPAGVLQEPGCGDHRRLVAHDGHARARGRTTSPWRTSSSPSSTPGPSGGSGRRRRAPSGGRSTH